MIMKKLISIVTPTYTEEANIEKICVSISKEMSKLNYDYEHIIIDNFSTDNTIPIIKKIAEKDKRVKIIINSRNFGHLRSPVYGILQSSGDACILMMSDFQDPPELIPKYLAEWEKGHKIILAQKDTSAENFLKHFIYIYKSKTLYGILHIMSTIRIFWLNH